MFPDLPYLSHLLVVARAGSISAAATELAITQPTLSRQMQLLEDAVGAELLIREAKGIRLTDEGAQLVRATEPLLGEIRDVVRGIRSRTESTTGRLRFGCLTEVGQSYFFPKLLDFCSEHPGVEFEVQYLKEFEILAALRAGDLDCGIITAADPGESLVTYAAHRERIVVVTRRSFTATIDKRPDLTDARFVSYRTGDPLLLAWQQKHFRQARHPKVVLTVNSHRSMLDAVRALDLFAVMPWPSVAAMVEAGVVRVASPLELSGTLHWVRRDTRRTSRALKLFQTYLLASGD